MTRRWTALVLLVLLPFSAMATPPDSVDFRLEAHRWEHRLLVVFALSGSDDALNSQLHQFEGQGDGFRDRDLLLLTLAGTNGHLRSAPEAVPHPLTDAAVRRLYDRFGVPPDAFRMVLVGKDGTEKRRDAEPVTARALFDTIDAMPMRQREMREDSTGSE